MIMKGSKQRPFQRFSHENVQMFRLHCRNTYVPANSGVFMASFYLKCTVFCRQYWCIYQSNPCSVWNLYIFFFLHLPAKKIRPGLSHRQKAVDNLNSAYSGSPRHFNERYLSVAGLEWISVLKTRNYRKIKK